MVKPKRAMVNPHMQNNSNILDLPSSTMIDILSRLPIKTVIHSRCVCKLWNNLFLDPTFPSCYVANSPTLLLITLDHGKFDSVNMVDVQDSSVHDHGCLSPTLTNENESNAVKVGSSCNGFACLCEKLSGSPVCLWNPIRKEYKMLPKATSRSVSKVLCGLGFADNKYKVIRTFKSKVGDDLWEAEVNTVGTKTWRSVGKVPYKICDRSYSSVYFHGAIHWIIDGHDSQLLSRFIIKDERFSSLPPPPIYPPSISKGRRRCYWSNMGVFEDCLSICATDAVEFNPPVQVWVMKKYDVSESWSKRFEIKNPPIEWCNPYRRFQVLKVMTNGLILILCSDSSLIT